MRPMSRVSDHAWGRLHAIESLADQKNRCAFCQQPLRRSTAMADHVKARSRGGTTHRENIKATCEPCNQAKGAMSEKAFKAVLRSPRVPARLSHAMAWVRFRTWRRTHKACDTIERIAR